MESFSVGLFAESAQQQIVSGNIGSQILMLYQTKTTFMLSLMERQRIQTGDSVGSLKPRPKAKNEDPKKRQKRSSFFVRKKHRVKSLFDCVEIQIIVYNLSLRSHIRQYYWMIWLLFFYPSILLIFSLHSHIIFLKNYPWVTS